MREFRKISEIRDFVGFVGKIMQCIFSGLFGNSRKDSK